MFAAATDQVDSTASDGFTPRILASYSVNDNVTLNAQASQGFRLGGVNDPLNVPLCDPSDVTIFGGFQSYGDETMWNYEAGVKSRFGNGVTFNAAAFYSDIKDLQVTFDVASCSSRISYNVPKAHTAGVEFELSANPTESLQLSLAGSVLKSEFDSTVRDGSGNILVGLKKATVWHRYRTSRLQVPVVTTSPCPGAAVQADSYRRLFITSVIASRNRVTSLRAPECSRRACRLAAQPATKSRT